MSAKNVPQNCGKDHAALFNTAGLISWLKGRFPVSTGYHVQSRTGISAASVENWLHRRSRPSVEHFSVLLSVFGPSLVRACLRQSPEWIESAVELERGRSLDAEIQRLQQERDLMRAAS